MFRELVCRKLFLVFLGLLCWNGMAVRSLVYDDSGVDNGVSCRNSFKTVWTLGFVICLLSFIL